MNNWSRNMQLQQRQPSSIFEVGPVQLIIIIMRRFFLFNKSARDPSILVNSGSLLENKA